MQAMKAAGKELKTAMKRDELDITGIERMQDDMADIMVAPHPSSPCYPGWQQCSLPALLRRQCLHRVRK